MKLQSVHRLSGDPFDIFRFTIDHEWQNATVVFTIDVKTKGDLGAAEKQAVTMVRKLASEIAAAPDD